MSYEIETLTSNVAFKALRTDWNNLLNESDADSLFMSWDWLHSWWSTWSDTLNLKLFIVIAKQNNIVVGILPLFRDEYKPRYSVSRSRLQFIGTHYLATPTVRTEYASPILSMTNRLAILEALVSSFSSSLKKMELVVCDTCLRPGSSAEQLKSYLFSNIRCSIMRHKVDTGYVIGTTVDFEQYVSRLGKNTRKKYFRDLSKLSQLGAHSYETRTYRVEFFETLNRFHLKRWGKKVFDAKVVTFYNKIFQSTSITPIFRWVEFENHIISLYFGLEVDGIEYFIQSGFDVGFKASFSLGKIQLGFSIKSVFDGKTAERFDLLAGSGKYTDYKAHLGSEPAFFESISFTKSPTIAFNYRALKYLKKIKKLLTGLNIK